MKNTRMEYSSTERTPSVLPEMAELLPPLSEEQLAALEADLLKNGCYSPVIVNEDMVIVDGHNRQSLCEKHGIPYKMAVFSFEDLLEAKQWALDTQKGRRNLDKWELGKIALKLKPEVEARAKANQSAAGGNKYVDETASGNVAESGFLFFQIPPHYPSRKNSVVNTPESKAPVKDIRSRVCNRHPRRLIKGVLLTPKAKRIGRQALVKSVCRW